MAWIKLSLVWDVFHRLDPHLQDGPAIDIDAWVYKVWFASMWDNSVVP